MMSIIIVHKPTPIITTQARPSAMMSGACPSDSADDTPMTVDPR